MNSLKLAVVVSAVMLSVTSFAQADSADRLNHNFMSKRAYQAPVENTTSQANQPWEGATYRPAGTANDDVARKNAYNLNQLKMHSIARRSY